MCTSYLVNYAAIWLDIDGTSQASKKILCQLFFSIVVVVVVVVVEAQRLLKENENKPFYFIFFFIHYDLHSISN